MIYILPMIRTMLHIVMLCVLCSGAFFLGMEQACLAGTPLIEQRREAFENAVSTVSRQYIGIPADFGIPFKTTGTMDNSHLFNLIYTEAAEMAGLRYLGYAPMERLMERTVAVPANRIRIGDLVVLNNGLAALICGMESPDKFNLVYVSGKRRSVISFNSRNVVYEAYWMKHLKGYYRLTPYNFSNAR